MAAVTLDRCFLSLASDPAQQVAFFSNDRSEQLSTPGEVRRYANGRLRVVRRTGTATQLGVTAVNITSAQVATLRSWAGSVVLFRDVWGRKQYSVYFDVAVIDSRDRQGQDVKLTLSEVSFSEVK